MRTLINSLALLALLLAGCSETRTPDPVVLGTDYAPVTLNRYWLYRAYEKNYSDFSPYQEREFELRIQVNSQTLNQAGDTVYTLVQQSRASATEAWQFDSAWQVIPTLYYYLEQANNLPQVVLSFPIRENKEWNANQFNADSVWLWEMNRINQPFTVNDSTYTNTLTLWQRNIDDPIIESDIRYRVFQRGVGEVYRHYENIRHCYQNPTCNPQAQAERIKFYTLRLIESGTLRP